MALVVSQCHMTALDKAVQCHMNGEVHQAEGFYREVLASQPHHAKATQFLGVLLFQSGQEAVGLQLLERATELNPYDSESWSNLGNAYFASGLNSQAVTVLEKSIQLDGNNASAHCTMSACLRQPGTMSDSIESARRALRLNSHLVQAHCNLGNSLIGVGDISGAIAAFEQALYLAPNCLEARQSHTFALQYSDRHSAQDILVSAQKLGSIFPYVAPKSTTAPLKTVAFLSGDYLTHPVAFFLDPLLRNLDRIRHKVVLLSNSTKSDSWTEKLQSYGDEFHDVTGLSDQGLKDLCSEREIDCVIDLSGHTASNRLGALALRLAPLQASWLGYSGTTGLPNMDWIVADRTLVAQDQEGHYTERTAALPGSAFCFDPSRITTEVAEAPCLKNGFVTFGSYNNLAKLSPQAVALWSEVMHKVEGSRLVLKTLHLGEAKLADKVRHQFAQRGIDPVRLTVSGHIDALNHFASFSEIDIVLDSTPYSGATTTVEAVYMGVPVVTLLGDRYAGRMSASILARIGKSDWIASDSATFVDTAVQLARDFEDLEKTRQGLRDDVEQSDLCDGVLFAKFFQDNLDSMWSESLTGQSTNTETMNEQAA